MFKCVVSSEWLHNNLSDPNLIILDASQKSVTANLVSDKDGLVIKGARFFDIKNDFSEKESQFPNTLCGPEQFQNGCRKLGINSTSKIVVNDNLGIYSSPRVWWMFKAMGHENIYVLDGGLPDWISKGYETEGQKTHRLELGDFKANFKKEMVKDLDFVKTNLVKQNALVIDARSADRFNGLVAEPRKELRRGSIPHSINIPFEDLLEQGKFKSKEELKQLLEPIKATNKPLVFSCGSGITACVVLLASELVEAIDNNKSVYDGSWTEWAQLVD